MAGEWPRTQTCDVEFVSVSWRAGSWISPDMGKGFFQNINESNRGLLGIFSQVIRNSLIDI